MSHLKFDMSSKITTLWLAVFFGFSNALSKYLLGHGMDSMLNYFLLGGVGGALMVLAVMWIILAILGKWYMHITASNWALLLIGCFGILRAALL